MRCSIWHHLYNLENAKKKNHGGVLPPAKSRALAFNSTRSNTFPMGAWGDEILRFRINRP